MNLVHVVFLTQDWKLVVKHGEIIFYRWLIIKNSCFLISQQKQLLRIWIQGLQCVQAMWDLPCMSSRVNICLPSKKSVTWVRQTYCGYVVELFCTFMLNLSGNPVQDSSLTSLMSRYLTQGGQVLKLQPFFHTFDHLNWHS